MIDNNTAIDTAIITGGYRKEIRIHITDELRDKIEYEVDVVQTNDDPALLEYYRGYEAALQWVLTTSIERSTTGENT